MLNTQPNAKIHALATIIVCGLGILCGISKYEWCWIVASVSLVWAGEALNTSIEMLADVVHAGEHPDIKAIKDTAAGAVLVLACGAAAIGAVIFWPYFIMVR
jgi:diacylglycerol kinase